MSSKKVELEVGATFTSQSLAAYGQPSKTIWEVVAINRTTDGLRHARLVNAADHLSNRMVAVDALLDRNFYRRAG